MEADAYTESRGDLKFIPYYIILYYTIIYHIVLYYTIV